MWSTIKQAFGLIDASRRRPFALVVLGAIVVSLMEIASAGLIFVLLQLVLEPGRVPDVPLLGDPTRFVPGLDYQGVVVMFAIVFGIFFVIRSALFLFQQYAMARVVENTGVMLTATLADGYLSMPYRFHLSRTSSELMRNTFDNVNSVVDTVFKTVATVLSEAVLVVAMLGVLALASPAATALVALLMAIAVLLTFRGVQPRLRELGQDRQRAVQASLQAMQQAFGGIRDITILGRHQYFMTAIRDGRRDMARPNYLRTALSYVPRVALEFVFLGFVLLILVVSVRSGQTESALSTLGLFAYAGLRLQPSLQKIAQSLNSLRFAEAAVKELTVDIGLFDERARALPSTDNLESVSLRSELVFHDVTFTYASDTPPALSSINLTLKAGHSLGISGHTGGGKTTFLDLLCGLLPPTAGRITVDGHDLADDVARWQQSVGVVHQSSFLIDDTLRANIAFGVPGADISDHRVDEAVAIAELTDVVAALPDGLDTIVGERGIRLSGGQRQRVTLARAVYRRPELLILDEGTSALDNVTEARIIANLEAMHGQLTLVMVAHRIQSLQRCDQILLLEAGGIVASGSYEELALSSDRFRSLIEVTAQN